MFYDFHIHTQEFSYCADSSAKKICHTAINNGLDGIALTEHDVWWPRNEMERLRNRFPELLIMPGVEYTCPEEHFLIFLPAVADAIISPALGVEELVTLVHGLGGIVIWSHPFRWDRRMPEWLNKVRPDGMEVASNNMDSGAQAMAQKVAKQEEIMMFRNSDAHHWRWLGKHANDFPCSLKGVDDFINYVRQQH